MKKDTRLVHTGRNPAALEASVNVPVHRASTIISPDLESYLGRFAGDRRYDKVTYGASGTQTARALAKAVAALEDGYRTIVTASGLSACTLSIAALVEQGDHILLTDSVYGPTRRFCTDVLRRYGVEVEFYDPAIGAGIGEMCRDNTRLVFTEAPGSLTFEMQDVPAITQAAHECGALVAMDNTWATPLYFQPLAHGVDISIQAGTKYIAGHSDLVIGLVTTREESLYRRVVDYIMMVGDIAGPDDCYLALRGLRTMAVRLRQQFASAMRIARWLQEQPAIKRVVYPPLPEDPGHAVWAKDYEGGASLFGLVTHSQDLNAVTRFVDNLALFSIGSSWGGYESLVAVNRMPLPRDVIPWSESSLLLRFHIGLEDPDDLIADLEQALRYL